MRERALEGERWERATRRRLADAFAVVWDYLVIEDPVTDADAIFCFGSRHWRVPERAAAAFHERRARWLLVTGAAPGGDGATEAERFAAGLAARGVPDDQIIREHAACHTGENVALGLQALRARTSVDRLLIVAWPLASRRCRATFAQMEPAIDVVSVPALRNLGYRWQPTARRARLALGELDRLAHYSGLGYIAPQDIPLDVDLAAAELRAELDPGVPSPLDRAPLQIEPAGPQFESEHPGLVVVER